MPFTMAWPMSESLDETLHRLVTQISSIRLKTELILSKHPNIQALVDIITLADDAQAQIQEGMTLLPNSHPE